MAILAADADAGMVRATTRLLGIAIALATLAAFGILLSRTLELNGGTWATLLSDMRVALAVTHFGHVWLWRIPALAVLWLAWGWRVRRPDQAWTGWTMALAIAAIALTRSETGHPADHGDFTIAVWVDWAHILAAGTWVGSLFGMSLAVFPALLRGGERSVEQTAEIFQRLSTLSGAALALLLACGIYNATVQLGSFHALWTTRYGVILDIKLAIVLAMIATGAHNRYSMLPRLKQAAGLDTRPTWLGRVFRDGPPTAGHPDRGRIIGVAARAVLVESLLGLAVIGATATLIHAMPPAAMPGAPPTHAPAAAPHAAGAVP
jgi:putative copper resistance protein D